MGVQVFNSLEIKSFQRINNHFELTTDQPVNLSTNQLLLCTNAFTKTLFPEIDIIPARGQVLLTSPIENLSWKGTFHSDEGYYYFRNLDNRVLLGGARNKAFAEEETTDMNTSDFIQHELEKYLDEVVLPNHKGQYEIEHRWAGIMAMGSEKLPIVKEIEPNIFCAVRMSGMGVALAPVVGQQIAQMMMK
jgi:gamma-glutamylputrescine oxidase